EARAAAAAKARQAEDEKARLAAERANKAEQEKAAAAAKAAETARIAAEKAKQIEEAKAAAAEQRRKDAEAAVAKALADKQAAEKALADKIANDKVAAVAPTETAPALSPQETAKLVQSELRRVGCLTGAADGDWSAAAQRSLTLFNKHAGTKLDTRLASFDALDAIKSKQGRVCPLVCDHGFRADGDACVKIACRASYRVNDDNECEKVQDKKPVATREDAKPRDSERKQGEAAPAKPQATGQFVCNTMGCRSVRPGCHLETKNTGHTNFNTEVCN
ncbi:caspase (peptidase), partial [Bradyrhizobium guangdongense]